MNTADTSLTTPQRTVRPGRRAASLALIAALTGVLPHTAAHAAPVHGRAAAVAADAATPCNAPAWPALPDLDFGRIDPGTSGSATESFVSSGAGQVSTAVTQGAGVFQVSEIEVYSVSRVREIVDPGELPHGYKGKGWTYQTVCSLAASTTGAGPVTVKKGNMVTISLAATPVAGDFSPTGTLAVSLNSKKVTVPMSLFVGGITVSLDSGSLAIPQGRSGSLAVTVTSLGGPDTDATFDLYDAVPGIAVTNPVVHVPSGQTVHAALQMLVSRGADLGQYPYNLAVSAFGGQQEFAVGSLTVTVTPLPTMSFTVPLGAAVDAWQSLRDSACAAIKDLTGREVDATVGRTIRDPQCYVAPLQLTASETGNSLQLTGSVPGNWESFYVTTPDGVPGDLDPKFQVNYDVMLALTVQLPATLDGASPLQVSQANLAVQNVYLDSHNLTGDLVEAVAKTFGDGQYFHPADYALGNSLNQVTAAVNTALAQLSSVLGAAPKDGFSQIQCSLDPTTLVLTATIS